MVPYFQCTLVSLEEATQSTPKEAYLITEHTEALFKEKKKAHRKAQSEAMGEFCRFLVSITGLQQGSQSYK